MFSNVIVYKIGGDASKSCKGAEKLLSKDCPAQFEPCLPSSMKSMGFVPVSGDEFCITSGSGRAFKVMIEDRQLSTSVVSDALAERVASIEEQQERKVYRKEKLALKDELVQDMMPRAFTKKSVVFGFFDAKHCRIFLGCSSPSVAESILNMFRYHLGTFVVIPELREEDPGFSLNQLYNDNEGQPFFINDEITLKLMGEHPDIVSIKGSEAVFETQTKDYIEGGYYIRSASLVSKNWRVKFKMENPWALKRIRIEDEIFANNEIEDDQIGSELAVFVPTLNGIMDDLTDWLS